MAATIYVDSKAEIEKAFEMLEDLKAGKKVDAEYKVPSVLVTKENVKEQAEIAGESYGKYPEALKCDGIRRNFIFISKNGIHLSKYGGKYSCKSENTSHGVCMQTEIWNKQKILEKYQIKQRYALSRI